MASLVEKRKPSFKESLIDTKTFLNESKRMLEQLNSNLVPSPSLLDKKLSLMQTSGI